MQVSGTEFNRFLTFHAPVMMAEGQRLGQAWHNHFKIHQHTPSCDEEAHALHRIYNEPDQQAARMLIHSQFVDFNQ